MDGRSDPILPLLLPLPVWILFPFLGGYDSHAGRPAPLPCHAMLPQSPPRMETDADRWIIGETHLRRGAQHSMQQPHLSATISSINVLISWQDKSAHDPLSSPQRPLSQSSPPSGWLGPPCLGALGAGLLATIRAAWIAFKTRRVESVHHCPWDTKSQMTTHGRVMERPFSHGEPLPSIL